MMPLIIFKKPIAIDRFNSSVKRTVTYTCLKGYKEEEANIYFIKSNLKKQNFYYQNQMD
jgi:hypothetical protein